MDRINTKMETLPPPPGILGSLRKGFDTIAANITAILLPLALDLFLWLGPHLRIDQLIESTLNDFLTTLSENGVAIGSFKDTLNSSLSQENIQNFNLISILRTFPIGVSSLMGIKMPARSPLGLPYIWQVDSPELLLGLILLFTVTGWIIGGLYFKWIAALVAPDSSTATGQAVFQTLVYSFFWAVIYCILVPPLTAVFLFLSIIYPVVGGIFILVVSFMSMWLIVPVFFSPHGMFVRKQNAFVSILSSFQISRFTLPTSSLFVLTVLLIGIGLNFLWVVPSDDSWLILVAIFGHAFITTALLASSFVYYRDMGAWLQTVLQRLQSGIPTKQA